MSFDSEYWELQKKRKKKEEEKKKTSNKTSTKPYASRLISPADEIAPIKTFTPTKTIAPAVTTSKKDDERTWFKKGSGGVVNTILGTVADIGEDIGTGIIGMGEKAVDFLTMAGTAMGNAQMSQLSNDELAFSAVKNIGKDKKTKEKEAESIVKKYNTAQKDAKKGTTEFVKKDLYNEEAIAKKIITTPFQKATDINVEASSVLGEKSDALLQSGGQLLATAGLQAMGVPWFLTTGATSFGAEAENALNQGATFEQATMSAAVSAGAEILTEKLSGGIKFGGKTLDDVLLKPLTEKISSKALKTLTNLGVDALGEGAEEVVSGVLSNLGTALYKEDDLTDILFSEEAVDEYIESFIGGAALGGFSSSVRAVANRNAIELTDDEQKVFDKVVEERIAEATKDGKTLTEMEEAKIRQALLNEISNGDIDTEKIESILDPEEYEKYKKVADTSAAYESKLNEGIEKMQQRRDELQKEYDELNELDLMTAKLGDHNRQNDIKQEMASLDEKIQQWNTELEEYKNDKTRSELETNLKTKLGQNVFELVKDTELAESYRRKQAFEADTSKYKNENARQTVQNAIDSGLIRNSKADHDAVDFIAKVTSKLGLVCEFSNNEKITNDYIELQTQQIAELEKIPEAQRTQEQINKLAKMKDALEKVKSGKRKVNGSTKKGVITINLDSVKPVEFITGHEILHNLIKSKIYVKGDLHKAFKSYLGEEEYAKRLAEVKETYEGNEATPEEEFAANLVGEYIFNDYDFVMHLATTNHNMFRNFWDSIKHLYKMATAGSKEARDLERVKRNFEKAYKEVAKSGAKVEGAKNSLIGINKDGIEVYETSQDTMNLTWDERKAKYLDVLGNEYRGKKARFERNGHVYLAEFDQSSIRKHIYGDDRSSPKGKKALIKAGADGDIFDLVENSQYDRSKKNTKKHTKADYFDYFIKTVQIDGKVFDLVADVEKNYGVKEGYVYTLALRDNKTIKASPATGTSQSEPLKNAGNASIDDIISQNSEKSSEIEKHSLSDEQEAYFKDSKVRDENGNLKVMYHGTRKGGFNSFDTYGSNYGLFGTGSYFTDNKSVAESYTKKGEGDNRKVYESYLNITNPLDMDAEANPEEWKKAFDFDDIDFPESGTNEQFFRAVEQYYTDEMMYKWEVAEIIRETIESGMGYDGITHIGGGRVNADGTRHQVYIAFEPEQIKNIDNVAPTKDADIRYSLSETDNKYLSAVESGDTEAAQRMVDEVARENGYTIKAYHGGDKFFTVFGKGNKTSQAPEGAHFFSSNKDVAYSYTTYKRDVNTDVNSYPVYEQLTREGTFEKNRVARGGVYSSFLKLENPYIVDFEGEYYSRKIDGRDINEIAAFARDNGYDGVIAKNIKDPGDMGDANWESKPSLAVADDYIVFNPNQIKSAEPITYDDNGNVIPLSERFKVENNDIRFSLLDNVEETKELVAVHNLSEEKLLKSLKLGGLPMPSIAIARAKEGHSSFGSISLVFGKDTISPTNRQNKVYSGDAWTPVYPRVEYEVSDKAQEKIEARISSLISEDVIRDLGGLRIDSYNLQNDLDRFNGNMVDAFRYNTALKYAFLVDSGNKLVLPTKNKPLAKYSNHKDDAIIRVAETVSEDKLRGILQEYTTEQVYEAEPEIRKAVNEYLLEKYKDLPKNAKESLILKSEMPRGDIDNYAQEALNYLKNGLERGIDYKASRELIDEVTDIQKYENWLKDLFANIVQNEGIRNNKDLFTPSGNRRSFKALHYEHTLENVVKAMKETGEKGVGAFGGGNIFGASTTEYSSVAEIKKDAQKRMKSMSEDEYDAIRKGFRDRLFDLAYSLPIHKDSFTAVDDASNMLIEAVSKFKTKSGMANYLRNESKGWANYSEHIVDDLIELVNDIRNMPVGYFEAKPQRAVRFNEVATAIIPDNASEELKRSLAENGVKFVEYEKGNEQARIDVLNSLDEYKFSVSDDNGTSKGYATFYGRKIADRNIPLADIAPVKAEKSSATVSKTEKVGTVNEDDYAPMTEAEAGAMYEADKDYINTFTDADMPPEMDAPIYSSDTTSIDEKALNNIAKTVKDALSLSVAETKAIKDIIQKYSTSEYQSEADLFEEIKANFGEKSWSERNEEIANVKQVLRSYKINVSPTIKRDITDYAQFRRRNFGKITFSKEGIPVDTAYMELSGAYPSLFPASITNATDQLLQMVEVANMEINETQTAKLDDESIQEVTELIVDVVNTYKENELLKGAKAQGREFLKNANKYEEEMPKISNDFAPTREYEAIEPRPDVLSDEEKQWAKNKMTRADKVDAEEKPRRRSELHQSIVDKLKSKFTEKGFDFDDVLNKAKNLSTIATVDNIPQRVMEKTFGYKQGQILADETVNKVAQNESEGIKWLNSFTDRKNGVLAQISKQYNIKPGSKKSAAAQMYAEGFYVNKNNEIIEYGDRELAIDFPDLKVQANIKGLARDPRIRKIYDDTLNAINESRSRNLYPEIPRLDNYFLHFRAMEDTFSQLGLPFNPNDIRAKDLPTDLNGVTADLKPGQPYFASAKHREGMRTSFDLLGGLERYLSSAKNQIYHIDDIQTLRALRNYIADTYGQAKGLESLDDLTDEEAQYRIEQVYSSHLSTFAKFLNEEANVLAGKTTLIDRGLEGVMGRKAFTFFDTLNKQVGSNMVGWNISSSLTNFLPVAQTFAKTNKFDFTKAFAQTVSSKIGSIFGKTDSFVENNPTIIRRKGAERFYRTPYQKIGDAGYVLMSAVDDISTELIVRTKYNELTRKGMDEQKASFEADKWVSRLMGDRSLGQQPQLYNSKILGLFTKFQLEVRNQLDSQFYDTIQEAKVSNEEIENKLLKNAKTAAKVTSVFFQLAAVQHLYGMAFESIAGYNPAFDIIDVLIKTLGFDDDEEDEDTPLDNLGEGLYALAEDLPYASLIVGSGRIPISSALPVKQLWSGKDKYGNEKSRVETLKETAPYYLLPTGYGQLKKTAQGLGMFNVDEPIAPFYGKGNIDLNSRPVVENEDGTISTVRSMSFNEDGKEILIPTVVNGKIVSDEEAVEHYHKTGEYLGKFDTVEEAEAYAEQLHKDQEKLYSNRKNKIVAGSYTDSGNLRFPVEDNLKNRIQAGVFGQYANKNARTYFDEDYAPLKENQIKEYAEADMPIADYWKYREGLKDFTKQDEKAAYINGLDISKKQKDVLKSYLYDEEGYKEENPEKYAFLEREGIGYLGYKELDEDTQSAWSWAFKHQDEYEHYKENGVLPGDYSTYYIPMLEFEDEDDEAYQWSFDNPEKATVGKVFGEGVKEYRQYAKDLNEIKADKDENGKSISGSAKEKKKAYIWSLDIDEGAKYILFKNEYNADDTYNNEIIDYLNSRDDISYDDMNTILEELGFTVDRETGYISWD